MFSFFSNKDNGPKSIILDIQSGLVRGALIAKVKQKNDVEVTHILSVVTKSIADKTHIINAEHLTKKTLKLISEVIEHLIRDANGSKIIHASYTLSSPWIFTMIKTIRSDFDKDTIISSKMVSDLINDDLKKNSDSADTQLIEQNIFEIKLNGYPLINFEGRKAHTLEISISNSLSSRSFINKVNETLNRYLHINNSKPHSALLMQYTALRDILKNRSEFIHIHIHKELTDIIIVKDGLCKHISSFPFGISTLLRKISVNAKQSIEASDSILSLYQGDKLVDSEKENIKNVIDPLIQEWSKQCLESIRESFDINSVPRTIFLSSHSHFDLFKNTLVNNDQIKFEVISYDVVDTGNTIVYKKGASESNMTKIYVYALNNEI